MLGILEWGWEGIVGCEEGQFWEIVKIEGVLGYGIWRICGHALLVTFVDDKEKQKNKFKKWDS